MPFVAPGDTTTITGCSVGGPGDGLDWLNEPRFLADTGSKSLDLQSTSGSSISTVIPTVSGDVYDLSFSALAVTGFNNTLTLNAGSLVSQTFAIPFSSSFPDFSTQIFTPFSIPFTAIGSTTTVQFLGAGTVAGVFIDTVSVVHTGSSLSSAPAPVPEPGTIILLGSGLIGLVGYNYKRNKKQK